MVDIYATDPAILKESGANGRRTTTRHARSAVECSVHGRWQDNVSPLNMDARARKFNDSSEFAMKQIVSQNQSLQNDPKNGSCW